VYTPRLSLISPSIEDLTFCAIPSISIDTWVIPSLVPQINLFAGQLYLKDAHEYMGLCQFLGLCYEVPSGDIIVAVDG